MHAISSNETQQRRSAVDFARGCVRLEGVILSPAIEALNAEFVSGQLSNDEHTVRCIQAIKESAADATGNSSPSPRS